MAIDAALRAAAEIFRMAGYAPLVISGLQTRLGRIMRIRRTIMTILAGMDLVPAVMMACNAADLFTHDLMELSRRPVFD
jgi:hypothetical protein